jgi:hypothetical protein
MGMTVVRSWMAVATFLILVMLLSGCSLEPAAAPPTVTLMPPAPKMTAISSATPKVPATLAPSATSTPLSGNVVLSDTLLVDSAAGRLYARGLLNQVPKTLVLAAADGRALAAYDAAGLLGLDAAHGWLYVDGPQGLTILEAATGALHAVVALPAARTSGPSPAPLADTTTGLGLAFRDHVVYVFDPENGSVVRTIPFEVKPLTGGPGPVEIDAAVLDPARRILYLRFPTVVCTPCIGSTLLSYDLTTGTELARQDDGAFQAMTSFDGYLYAMSYQRMPPMDIGWVWLSGRPWRRTEGWMPGVAAFVVDPGRMRLYQTVHDDLYVFDMPDMTLRMSIARPEEGLLAGYDPVTDQLYFLADGELRRWSPAALESMTPEPPPVETPPAVAVHALAWTADGTWFGLWAEAPPFGSFYASRDAGQTWGQLRGGLPNQWGLVQALALSPDYTTDHTLWASVFGWGIYRSRDGGSLWLPASAGLTQMAFVQLWISPGFAQDRTLLACGPYTAYPTNFYRSLDGGDTWQPLAAMTSTTTIALSPAFARDRTLLGLQAGGRLRLSRDAGTSWQPAGALPPGASASLLSLAPTWPEDALVFAYGGDGQDAILYRSRDGGQNWSGVLDAPALTPKRYRVAAQIVYSPDFRATGEMFVLVSWSDERDDMSGLPLFGGTLYRSTDRGLTWQVVPLPENLSPTAVALSPDFARDGQLLVGTADGRVLTITRR